MSNHNIFPPALLEALEQLSNPDSDPLLVEHYRQVWLGANEAELQALEAGLHARVSRACRVIAVLGIALLGLGALVVSTMMSGSGPEALQAGAAPLALVATVLVQLVFQREARLTQLDFLSAVAQQPESDQALTLARSEACAQVHLDEARSRQRVLRQLDVVILRRLVQRARELRSCSNLVHLPA